MITEFNLNPVAEKKISILNNLKKIKEQDSSYSIIDVGGAKEKHVKDKFNFIDAYADFGVVSGHSLTHFNGNLNDPNLWNDVKSHTSKNGLYDYCICTHTLEDLSSPSYVASQIALIAKEGLLSFPSKYKECSRFELEGKYRGYIHHRWIFTISDGFILSFPKLNLIEDSFFDTVAKKSNSKNDELCVLWENKIPFRITNNDWLGPNPSECLKRYKGDLLATDEDSLL